MKTPEKIKKEKIDYLNWCLEKLKFYDTGKHEEYFEELYRYIYELIVVMDGLEGVAANNYYYHKVKDGYLEWQLQHYDIELNI